MAPLTAYGLRCEHLAEARGLNTRHPRFSWALSGPGQDRRQTAYQIVVGDDPAQVATGNGNLWDSGKINSSRSQMIEYAGPALRSRQALHWSVRVWDEADRPSTFAAAHLVLTGLLDQTDWSSQWIGRKDVPPGEAPDFYRPLRYDPSETHNARPVEYLRREFRVEKGVRRAYAYASALGVYKLSLNGKQLGREELAPGWTDYHKRVDYQIYDLTDALLPGQNVVGAMVGEGWYCGRVGLTLKKSGAHYGPKQLFICQLEIEYDNGTTDVIATDLDWRARTGPIIFSDLLLGERYDAEREIPGWDTPDSPVGGFGAVETAEPKYVSPELNAPRSGPILRHDQFEGRFLHRTAAGALIFDFGQNLVGFNRLEIANPVAGGSYVMRHGEALEQDGSLYTKNLRSALQEDIYNAAGSEAFAFEPLFTLHGYRYVELTGPQLNPDEIGLTATAVHSKMSPAGQFSCGSELVNQLQSSIVWSTKGNFVSIPTDCPQRDERLGWLCDAQVFFKTACLNFDAAAFMAKWLQDVFDAQQDDGAFTDVAPSKPHQAHWFAPPKGAPGWADAGILMPYQHYCQYGDVRILERFYRGMGAFMDYLQRNNPDGMRRNALNRNYGDWFSLGSKTDNILVAQAYWALDAAVMSKVAQILGKADDVASYQAHHEQLTANFGNAFVHPDGTIGTDTQTSYLLPLAFGLLSDELAALALDNLVLAIERADGHLSAGFLGLRHLAPVLSQAGRPDLAYDLLLKDTMPSWLYAIKHADATTIWERWDFYEPEQGLVDDPKRSSLNHYAFGAVGEWLFTDAAGIDWDPTSPGFEHVVLSPHPSERMGTARAEHISHRGRIRAQWSIENGVVSYSCELPPNTRGTLTIDAQSVEAQDGRIITPAAECPSKIQIKIGSGAYSYRWKMPNSSEHRANKGLRAWHTRHPS